MRLTRARTRLCLLMCLFCSFFVLLLLYICVLSRIPVRSVSQNDRFVSHTARSVSQNASEGSPSPLHFSDVLEGRFDCFGKSRFAPHLLPRKTLPLYEQHKYRIYLRIE